MCSIYYYYIIFNSPKISTSTPLSNVNNQGENTDDSLINTPRCARR